MVTFTVLGGASGGEDRELTLSPDTELAVAGYTGRDPVAVKHHIDELAAIGVAPPPAVPMVYRYPPSLLTTAGDLTVASLQTSGEVEPVLVRQGGAWYLGVGSDHTDRGLERESVERSKAVCPKPVSRQLIAVTGNPADGALDAVWDRIQISSRADGELYQSAGLESMRLPSDLLPAVLDALPDGADLVVFCGTVPLRTGTFVYATNWAMELKMDDTTVGCDYSTTRQKPEHEFFPVTDREWTTCAGAVPQLTERILAAIPGTGVATRILNFAPGTDTTPNGVQVHDFWEEVYILQGAMTDIRLGETFTAGMYACRPPGMPHGPWTTVEGCRTFEVRYRAAPGAPPERGQ